jgi:hypothetical protein
MVMLQKMTVMLRTELENGPKKSQNGHSIFSANAKKGLKRIIR